MSETSTENTTSTTTQTPTAETDAPASRQAVFVEKLIALKSTAQADRVNDLIDVLVEAASE